MLTAGVQIGPYKILGRLGAGGMGEVYRAWDARLGREVALKVLPARFAEDPDRLLRFQREAKAVAALAHPNVLVVYDFGTDQGLTFAITELLEGTTLRERLAPSALPWRKAVELSVAVAEGLAAAHAKGIVHRDLKPDNIFVTSDERVKILDFGLAKLLAESPAVEPVETQDYSPILTQTGSLLGTAPYMSPEQLRAQAVDARSDLFSFGCMLYEMVAGKRPFTGNTSADITAAILHSDPPELTDSGKKVPLELERVIRRCLEKNPEARFQSARDLAFALRGIATGTTEIQPVRPSAGNPVYRWLAAGGVLLAVAATVFVLWPKNRTPELASPAKADPSGQIVVAVLPFVNTAKDAEAEYLCDGLPNGIIKSLTEVGRLKVRSFSSVARFAGSDTNLEDVARKLKVQAVLTGRITPRKDGIALTVELVNASDLSAIWSHRYEKKVIDLQDVQLDIAKQICTKLGLTLTGEEEKRLGRRYTANPEAHKFYLIGRHNLFKTTEESLKKAEECYLQAIDLDPNFALAYAGLADAYMFFAIEGLLPPRDAMPKSRDAAQKSLNLDGNLAEAHIAIAMVQFYYDWDWPGAEKELKRGVELNPTPALGYDATYYFLTAMGRFDEARKALEKAGQLEPMVPFIVIDNAWHYYFTRQYDKAIVQAQKVLEIDPNFATAFQCLGLSYSRKGQYQQAVAALEKARSLDDTPFNMAFLAYCHGVGGDKQKARNIAGELTTILAKKKRFVDPMALAIIHIGLGENNEALNWLEKAYAERSVLMVQLNVDPFFDPLSSEPRFVELVKKMKFP